MAKRRRRKNPRIGQEVIIAKAKAMVAQADRSYDWKQELYAMIQDLRTLAGVTRRRKPVVWGQFLRLNQGDLAGFERDDVEHLYAILRDIYNVRFKAIQDKQDQAAYDQFVVGDVVIVMKPKNTNESPGWIRDMDQFVGRRMEIEEITPAGFVLFEESGYFFSQKWLRYA